MTSEEQLSLIKQGAEKWNQWREQNTGIKPDLSGADLREAQLQKIDLSNANMEKTKLQFSNLTGANLQNANLKKAKLVICDSNQTTYLISFALNIPTLIFWNNYKCPITNEAGKYFNNLRKLKVYHTNSIDAANHLNIIKNDINKWWFTEDVQNEIKQFCKNYMLTDDRYTEIWSDHILNLLALIIYIM